MKIQMMYPIEIMKAATRVMDEASQTSEKVESMIAIRAMDEASGTLQKLHSIAFFGEMSDLNGCCLRHE